MIQIYEVGLRDGLQSHHEPVPTDAKVELVERLSEAGLPYIEVGSFISPKAGQMFENLKDTVEVYQQASKRDGVVYSALVPTLEYFMQAKEAGFRHVAVVVSANEEHNRKNLGRGIKETLMGIRRIKAVAADNGIKVRPYVSTAFGYKKLSDVEPDDLSHIVASVGSRNGVDGPETPFPDVDNVSLGDTFGLARYGHVEAVSTMCIKRFLVKPPKIALHFHQVNPDVWKPNMSAAIDSGIGLFDASLCGLGGCPTDAHMGNIPTGQLVDYLEDNNIDTGLDADKIHQAAEFLKKFIS